MLIVGWVHRREWDWSTGGLDDRAALADALSDEPDPPQTTGMSRRR
ncbi:Hypothetical protein PFR_JS8_1594 [Propionibacterium freudenreichii]|nr:Hypothetical protein PFR_J18_1105 [Propionibacterium freudenreichii]SBN52610.1 Hypothetical protein PFR_JS8_1594 [Propionibacterium freudenreichii]